MIYSTVIQMFITSANLLSDKQQTKNELFNEAILLLTVDGFFLFNHSDVELNYKLGFVVIGVVSLLFVYTFVPVFVELYRIIKNKIRLYFALRKYKKWRANHLLWIKKTNRHRKNFLRDRRDFLNKHEYMRGGFKLQKED